MRNRQKWLRWGQLPLASLDPSKRGAGRVKHGLVVQLVKGFHGFKNYLASFWKMIHDLLVGETNHLDTKFFEKSSTFGISSQTFWSVMLYPIKFNNQFARGTIKIHNKISNRSLSQPSFRLQTQKVIPKSAFSFGHLNPKFLRSSSQFFVVNQPWHSNTLPFPHLAPLFEGSSEARGSS